MGWVLWAAGQAGWYFFALGPQMVICLYLGYLAAKKTHGDLLNWLVAAFGASLIPLGGVIVMLAVWWRAGASWPGHHDGPPAPEGPQPADAAKAPGDDAPPASQMAPSPDPPAPGVPS